MKYSNQSGQFENFVQGNVVVSEYSGTFDEHGIAAIFSEIESMTSGLKHWCWHQKPDPKTVISKTGVDGMISRYTKIHVHGCVAIGVCYTNPEIDRISLPKDGSIKTLFKISRNRSSLYEFFDQALHEAEQSQLGQLQLATTAKAKDYDVITQFITATKAAELTSDELKKLVGYTKPQLDALPALDRQTLTYMQAMTALLGIVAFQLKPESLNRWLHTPIEGTSNTPLTICQEPDGIYKLFRSL
ncbi:hypothetical protein QTP81_11990 [Alteromonas sp. ASW11-36]|uniref:Uncharacterized protein n=1 Tax=Alteromonas arenosi TaxID=3055817 RepID=A0ABT7T0H4_9ALTE|nr:hypothetical protein [Alteromonas sp. ASW11-36]MDM7861317.1 hypothetical protein [Alteromonas sp. ASW11-36]